MKIIAMIQAYNELESGNLRRCLESVSKYCDHIAIYDDGSTDGSRKVYEEYNADVSYGARNEFNRELAHKQELVERIQAMGADWVWRIDCDEVIEKRGEEGGLRELCETTKYDSWAFHTVNLWRDPSFFRTDNSYNDVVFNRLWRMPPEGLHFDVKEGLHLTNYPKGMTNNEGFTDLELLHYGFASDKAIVDKYNMYQAHGQTGWQLIRLINENGLTVGNSNPAWFNFSLEARTLNEVFKTPISRKI